ncbi:hypothetical protein DEA8626_01212 [Defluviimonas aquaemixtae]|uniref:DUF2267 domain-containing protein n=1 Tax=Albidovulum aquaemixtae TaxID=1542388 RepID=A0A2R8B503_9RHOB|nr:DUF2267 domain-containing protein [Defluviimonas aquaemixtae]SPH17687.1 hypothetical protein DEA8626_01212 [Defluviimonas aquaemixtae]
MSAYGLKVIDEAVQAANIWVNEVDSRTGWDNKQRSYRLLRAVLHAVRDHLTVNEATDLGAQLPTLIRGVYYEGWNSSRNPVRMRHADDFVAAVQKEFAPDTFEDADRALRAVFDLFDSHVSAGEMKDIRGAFTKEIRSLFGVS